MSSTVKRAAASQCPANTAQHAGSLLASLRWEDQQQHIIAEQIVRLKATPLSRHFNRDVDTTRCTCWNKQQKSSTRQQTPGSPTPGAHQQSPRHSSPTASSSCGCKLRPFPSTHCLSKHLVSTAKMKTRVYCFLLGQTINIYTTHYQTNITMYFVPGISLFRSGMKLCQGGISSDASSMQEQSTFHRSFQN